MNKIVMALVFTSLIAFAGCKKEPSTAEAAIAELEEKFDDLEVETTGQTMTLKVRSDLITTTPYLEFFGAPEYWNNTYDVGFAECSSRCGRESVARRKACEATPDRPQCSESSLVEASQACQVDCADQFEVPITP